MGGAEFVDSCDCALCVGVTARPICQGCIDAVQCWRCRCVFVCVCVCVFVYVCVCVYARAVLMLYNAFR